MKKLIILLIAALPLTAFAGKGDKEKIDVRITTDKAGKVHVSCLNKNLKPLEKEINEALKDVTVNINDKKEKHQIHFKAELNIE